MIRRSINAGDAPAATGGYQQAMEIAGASRTLFVSGQIPAGLDGVVPTAFDDQCRLAWANVEAQLRASGMSLDHLVKVTTFIADRRYGADNGRIRREIMGDRAFALTVVIAGIFDSAWLLEIEAIAVA